MLLDGNAKVGDDSAIYSSVREMVLSKENEKLKKRIERLEKALGDTWNRVITSVSMNERSKNYFVDPIKEALKEE